MKDFIKKEFSEESRLLNEGFSAVVGIDEAGRGSLAGPVIAAAVMIKDPSFLKGMKFGDSKSMSEAGREKLFEFFLSLSEIEWGIGTVSSKTVDRINVLEATKMAMKNAISELEKKDVQIDALLIDGNFLLGTGLEEKAVIRGDEKIASCKIASIVAKVFRDRLMRRHSKKYPGYFFDRNKGYGTELHLRALKKMGHCPIHRKTFIVKKLIRYDL